VSTRRLRRCRPLLAAAAVTAVIGFAPALPAGAEPPEPCRCGPALAVAEVPPDPCLPGAALGGHGDLACLAAGTDLNPQPLPPGRRGRGSP